MGERLRNVKCPKCGHKSLIVNTDKWRPAAVSCLRRKCGWTANLKPFWPKNKEASKRQK